MPELEYEIIYYVQFYCPRCKNHPTETVTVPGDFDAFEAFNVVMERNVRGSFKAIGKCVYPGQGHVISNFSLTGIRKQPIIEMEEVKPLVKP